MMVNNLAQFFCDAANGYMAIAKLNYSLPIRDKFMEKLFRAVGPVRKADDGTITFEDGSSAWISRDHWEAMAPAAEGWN